MKIRAKKHATRKQILNMLYAKTWELTKSKRFNYLIKEMVPKFNSEPALKLFVEDRIHRKLVNLINRKIRFIRKANMNNFNFFVTFTFDDAKHTEESFKKKLKKCLSNFLARHD